MNEKPCITIITVVYNAKNTIEQSMLSVLNQTYSNIEYIIVDGASTDGTLDIIGKYETQIKKGEFSNVSFRYISEPDKGIYDAMNKGIDMATGDWVLFLGADDLLMSSINDYYNKFIDREVVYYGDVILLPSKQRYGGEFSKYTLSYKNISQQAIFYPGFLLKQYHFSLQYPICADYDLNIFLYSKNIKFEYIGVDISYFSTEGCSWTQRDIAFSKNYYKIIIKLGILPYLYSYYRFVFAKIGRLITYITMDSEMRRSYWTQMNKKFQRDLTCGLNDARREGEEKKAIEIAQNALSEGMKPELVQKITGLNFETVRGLINK